jgi:type II pantothenate kinase
MARVLLQLVWLVSFAFGKMLAPMRPDTALKLLDRLNSSPDLLSIDIGGTLAKVVLFQPCDGPPREGELPAIDLGEAGAAAFGPEDQQLSIYSPHAGGNLHFFVFETRFVADVIRFVGKHWRGGVPSADGSRRQSSLVMRATGGGAFKYAAELRAAGIDLQTVDEMGASIAGLSFLLRRIPGEVFALDMSASRTPLLTPAACLQLKHVAVPTPPQSYLYVSIGSGVSILEVHSDCTDGVTRSRYRRVGGSSMGGSTFWGLVRLLTSCSTFDEVIRLTEAGSSANVDMLVGDIYGGDCEAIGLRADVIAASFGKISMQREQRGYVGPMLLIRWVQAVIRHYEEGFWLVILAVLNFLPGVRQLVSVIGLARFAEKRAASVAMCGNFRAHDVALSLLRMVSNNIGQISTMCAMQYGMRHVVFGGSFIRDHPYTIATISSGVRFYSRGQVEALFLRHDGFVGAVGAHVTGLPAEGGVAVKMPDVSTGDGRTWQPTWQPTPQPQSAAPPTSQHPPTPQPPTMLPPQHQPPTYQLPPHQLYVTPQPAVWAAGAPAGGALPSGTAAQAAMAGGLAAPPAVAGALGADTDQGRSFSDGHGPS